MAGAIFIALGLFVGAGWFFVVPAIVQSRIDGFLRLYEPGHRSFRVHSIGLTEATITGIELGDSPWLEARSVTVRYTLSDLMRGQLQGIEMVDPTWRVLVRDGEVTWGFTSPPREAGPVKFTFDRASIHDGRVMLDVDGRRLDVPLNVSAATDGRGHLQGQLECAGITLDGLRFETLSSDFDFDGAELVVAAKWPVFSSTAMTAELAIDISAEHPMGAARVQQLAIALHETKAILNLIPGMRGIDMDGQVAMSIEWRIADGRADPLLTVRGADVSLASAAWPLAIASADGVLTFDSLSPLKTQGKQRMWIASATTGELDISAGELLASLDESSQVSVTTARWMMSDGGVFEASPFAVDLRKPRISTKISAANVSLDFWLRLLTGDRADGSGRLRGEFLVEWDPSAAPRLRFAGGSLVATPPTGFIRVHDAPMLSDVLDRSDPRFTVDQTLQTVKRRIIEALEDLGFTRLKLDFVPDDSDTLLRVDMEGQGRRGADAQRFSGLVVNIGHFARTLQDVLSTSSAIDRMRDLRSVGHPKAVPPVGEPPADMP